MDQQTFQKRQTAVKLWISDLLNATHSREEGEFGLNLFKTKNLIFSRVNLIANVIFRSDSEDNSYSAVTLDDGSGALQVKAWRSDTILLQDINIGSLILVIGKPRVYNKELYIQPEIVSVLDDFHWEILRKLELLKLYGKPLEIKEEIQPQIPQPAENPQINQPSSEEPALEIIEEQVDSGETSEIARQKILSTIEKISSDEGADIDDVIEQSGVPEEEADDVVQELLREGEIFAPRPGKLKVI